MPKEIVIRKKATEELRVNGWITWFAPKVKFQQTDIFGIIDLLALKGKKQKNIQLTTISNVSSRRKKIIDFLKRNKVQMMVEIWAWNAKKKEFKKEKINIKLKKLRAK
ncbi:MAG: hypothetical protein Q7S82_03850 [bacterium]|nr:hypothetical protein [bacterium]